MNSPRNPPAWAVTLVTAAIAAICFLTLRPEQGYGTPFRICLLCGERGLADAILNVLLFIPLGLGLAGSGVSARRIVAYAGLFSLTVELLQIWIPGRDSSVPDLLFNTVGAAVAATVWRLRAIWMFPSKTAASHLTVAAALTAMSAIGGTSILAGRAETDRPYFGQWTARLGHLVPYEGKVLEARVGDMHIPGYRLRDQSGIREVLQRRDQITVRLVAGPAPNGRASVFSIADAHPRNILFVGLEDTDIVLGELTRSAQFLLDRPWHRAYDLAADLVAGDTVTVRVIQADGGDACVEIGPARRCGLGTSPGEGWRLLTDLNLRNSLFEGAVSSVWIFALFLPPGFWIWQAVGWARAAPVIATGSLAIVPALGPLIQPGVAEWIGVALGFTFGLWLTRIVTRIKARGP